MHDYVTQAPDNDLFLVEEINDQYAIYEHYTDNYMSILDMNTFKIIVTLNTNCVAVVNEYFETIMFN